VIKNSGVSDHHAIIPAASISASVLSSLPSGERDVLTLIAVRLICAVGDRHSFETVKAVLECGGHTFTANGRTVIEIGWKALDDTFRATLKSKPEEEPEDDAASLPELAEGLTYRFVTSAIKEGKTTPPRRYTEDTLLSAMESAGSEDMPNDAERKGLGTPATRAATIEKLIKTGFVVRQKKSLVPTEKGINLVAILPEDIKSPMLTAQWEHQLKMIERGESSDSSFMGGIYKLTRELVASHRTPSVEYAALFGQAADISGGNSTDSYIGKCLRCGSLVVERGKGYFCINRACKFVLWKDNRFFEAKKKKLDKTTAAALLTKGRVFFSDLHSEKTGKTYAAAILLDDDGEKINYKLEFEKGRDRE